MAKIDESRAQYAAVMGMLAASLAPDEFWCIHHPGGPLLGTASKDAGQSVRIVCEALDADWDDLKEWGFSLGKTTDQPASKPRP